MAVDLSKIAASAIEAALDDGETKKRNHGSTVKAVAAGAALAVAAKAATSKRTKLMSKLVPTPSLDGLRDIPDRVRDRLADAGWLNDEEDVEDEEPVAEGEEDEEDDVDEEDEEPVDGAEEDWDDDEDDEDFDEDELDDDEEEDDDEPPPELDIESEDDEDLHPEDRPPKPPRSKEKAR